MQKINKKKLKTALQKFPFVKLIYFIGSEQKGTARGDSDLDLVFVVEEDSLENLNYSNLYSSINEVVKHSNLDLRVVTKNSDLLFLFQVIRGECIFAESEKTRVEFEKRTMKFYFDTQPIRNIFNYYLKKRIEEGNYGE